MKQKEAYHEPGEIGSDRELIQQWLPGSGVERYVASADIEAVKPA